jgi:hypothetical protein
MGLRGKLMFGTCVAVTHPILGEDPDQLMRVLKTGSGELVTIAGKTSSHPKRM